MSRKIVRFVVVALIALGCGMPVRCFAHPTASLTIVEQPGGVVDSGTITIAFNGHWQSVTYGPFSTPSSIAAAFAAQFSSYPASYWSPIQGTLHTLCMIGVCAKANGPTITFQLSGSGPFTSPTITGPTTSFTVNTAAWPPPVPMIVSLSPTSGAVGTSVTITGMNFGSTQVTSTVTFNGTVAIISSWSATSIIAEVPTGATTGDVAVTVSGMASNGVGFTVPGTPPWVASLNPSSGNVGLAVTISGSGFGAAEGQSTVTFNGAPAGVLNWSDSSITAVVPSTATTGSVVVKLANGQTSNNNVNFTVNNSSCP